MNILSQEQSIIKQGTNNSNSARSYDQQQILHQPIREQLSEEQKLLSQVKKITLKHNSQNQRPIIGEDSQALRVTIKKKVLFFLERVHFMKMKITQKPPQIQNDFTVKLTLQPGFLQYLFTNLSLQYRIIHQVDKELMKSVIQQSQSLRNLIKKALLAKKIQLSNQLKALFFLYNFIQKVSIEQATINNQNLQNIRGLIDQLTGKQNSINFITVLRLYFKQIEYNFGGELTQSQKKICQIYLKFLDHNKIQQKVWIILILLALTIQKQSKNHKYMIRKWNVYYCRKDNYGWNKLKLIERKQIIKEIFRYYNKNISEVLRSFLNWLIFYQQSDEKQQDWQEFDYLKQLAKYIPRNIHKTTIIYYLIIQSITKFDQSTEQIKLPSLPKEILQSSQHLFACQSFTSYDSIKGQIYNQLRKRSYNQVSRPILSLQKLDIERSKFAGYIKQITSKIHFNRTQQDILRKYDYILLLLFVQNCFIQQGEEIINRNQIIQAIIAEDLSKVYSIIKENLESYDFKQYRLD